jgi:uncharacterized protein YjbK
MTMMNREVELKLALDETAYEKLFHLLPSRGVKREQINTFFDSSDLLMRKNYWALRLRKDDSQWFLTTKGPSQRQQGISDRIEIEQAISAEQAEQCLAQSWVLSDLDYEPTRYLLEKFGDLPVDVWMSFQNQRQVLLFQDTMLELDHSSCEGQHRYECEVECSLEALQAITPELKAFFLEHDLPWSPSDQSKLAWAVEQSGRG